MAAAAPTLLEQDQLMEKEPYDKERKTIMRRAAVLPWLEMRCACRQLKTTLKMKIPPAAFKGQCFFLVGDCKS
jgi:hypothetical protein